MPNSFQEIFQIFRSIRKKGGLFDFSCWKTVSSVTFQKESSSPVPVESPAFFLLLQACRKPVNPGKQESGRKVRTDSGSLRVRFRFGSAKTIKPF